MKKIIVSLLLLLVSLYAEQDWLRSYSQAQLQARDENKSVFVMLSRESCDACWYMENIVFEDEKVSKLILDNFIPVYLDVNTDIVPEQFKYIGTPTFYFTDANGSRLGHRINGASNVKDFTEKINVIIQEAKRKR